MVSHGRSSKTCIVRSYQSRFLLPLLTALLGTPGPLRVGEVAILPVTGFSPGVGLFGAQATWDAEAMVEHQFRGSWKDE